MRNRWLSNLVAVVCLAALAVAVPARADEAAAARDKPNPTLAEVPASGYVPFTGQPFFLLSDASYGTDQEAMVRLEAPGREYKDELARYGGADILVYRVPQPLDFLKAQKNLHRIDVKANYTGEGLANTLAYLWDNWTRQARRAWQRVLSFATRSKAVEAAPQFSMGDQMAAPTRFSNPRSTRRSRATSCSAASATRSGRPSRSRRPRTSSSKAAAASGCRRTSAT